VRDDRFGATLGPHERRATLAAVALGIVGTTVVGIVFTATSGELYWLFLSLPLALILFVMGRFAPLGYRLAGDGVHVERHVGAKVIPYHCIRGVDRAPRPLAGLTVNGSRGVFGRFGRFWNTTFGFYRLYVTNRESLVWLDTESGWVGLSPDQPDEFVERLRARATRARDR
jgi:hypothetical protein